MVETTVSCIQDATKTRNVVIRDKKFTPPICCAKSRNGDGFPFFHSDAVACKKYCSVNMYKFVAARHLTESWRAQYDHIEYQILSQCAIDEVLASARQLVSCGTTVTVPVHLPLSKQLQINEGTMLVCTLSWVCADLSYWW